MLVTYTFFLFLVLLLIYFRQINYFNFSHLISYLFIIFSISFFSFSFVRNGRLKSKWLDMKFNNLCNFLCSVPVRRFSKGATPCVGGESTISLPN